MGRAEGTNPRAQGTNPRGFAGADDPATKQSRPVRETKQRYIDALDWAKRNVPDEHAPFAASAATTLRHRTGHWPEPAEVRARLIEQGRDMRTLEGA